MKNDSIKQINLPIVDISGQAEWQSIVSIRFRLDEMITKG